MVELDDIDQYNVPGINVLGQKDYAHDTGFKYSQWDASSCELDESLFRAVKLRSYHYWVDEANNFSIRARCLTNYKLRYGDLIRTCLPNGTWSGNEPFCETDYYWEKYRLSGFIILVSFLVPALWLGTDFYFWARKRATVRRIRAAPINDIRKMERLLGVSIHNQTLPNLKQRNLRLYPSATRIDVKGDKPETKRHSFMFKDGLRKKATAKFKRSASERHKLDMLYRNQDVEEHLGTPKRVLATKISHNKYSGRGPESTKSLSCASSMSQNMEFCFDDSTIASRAAQDAARAHLRNTTPMNHFAALGKAIWRF